MYVLSLLVLNAKEEEEEAPQNTNTAANSSKTTPKLSHSDSCGAQQFHQTRDDPDLQQHVGPLTGGCGSAGMAKTTVKCFVELLGVFLVFWFGLCFKFRGERLIGNHTNTHDSYAVSFLHCSLVERLKYGPIGWCRPYKFSHANLEAAIEVKKF